MSVDTSEWATSDVTNDVTTSAGGGEADGVELIEYFRDGFDAHPMELNILANGDVGDAIAVLGRKTGDGAELLAGEEAAGDADTHHEERSGLPFSARAADDAVAVALRVNAPSAEIGGEPFGRNGIVAETGELANFVEMVPSVFLAFETFDALGFGFLYSGHCFGNSLSTLGESLAWNSQAEACATRPGLKTGGYANPEKTRIKTERPTCLDSGRWASKNWNLD